MKGKSALQKFGVATAAVAMLGVAACSSGSSSGGGSGEVDQAGLTQAQEMVAAAEQRPTEIPTTEPITNPIPAGKEVVFVSCGTATCNLESEIIQQATDKLGWSLRTVTTDGTPERTKAVFQQLAQNPPDGVLYTALERETFEPELQRLKEAGVGVATCCTTDEPTNGIDFNIGNVNESSALTENLSAMVVADGEGRANSVYVDVPAYPIVTAQGEAYMKYVEEMCPEACETAKLDLPITSLGKDVPDRVVSYVRANPDLTHVVFGIDGISAGVVAAMRAAGINDVTVVGTGPDTNNLKEIAAGERGPSLAFPYYEEMFAMVDALARKFSNTPMPEGDVALPAFIITRENIPNSSELFPLVEDVQQQYFQLWGKA